MSPQLDEEQPDLVSEVQDMARLHVDLVRAEVRDGTLRLQRGLILLMLAAVTAGLCVLASAITVFLFLQTHFEPWVAAALTSAIYAFLALSAVAMGRHQLQGTRSFLLPRTRALLGELFSWRNDKSSTS
jgi:uncharacterized membrane protein YqjE